MNSTTIICDLRDIRNSLIALFEQEWSISNLIASSVYDDQVQEHIQRLKPTVSFVIETPYVDRVYRDSYYSYFATKLGNYKKDCIRLSLFNEVLTADDFRTPAGISALQSKYWGFMILRPTVPQVIGRCIISPDAIAGIPFLCLTSSYTASVNSIKLTATGFPHSSQDAETISCAETSVWAIMEYFSARYPDYKPALPSAIIKALRSRSSTRQIPSDGLQVDQISFALLEFGFATKVYSRANFGEVEFRRLFSTYVESGLPLVVAMDNARGGIAHALLVVGHEKTTDQHIYNLPLSVENDQYLRGLIEKHNLQFYDNDDIERQFVFIDDNMPAYQLQDYNTPANHYPGVNWKTCQINHFIVPLYPKMYLEAVEAKAYIKHVLLEGIFPMTAGSEIFLRVFLTSSRSYKDYIARETTFNIDIQSFILETPMPKFIWIGEISSKTDIVNKRAHGLFILDATEPNLENDQALLFGGYRDQFCYPDHSSKKLIINVLSLGTFNIYSNNLKGF